MANHLKIAQVEAILLLHLRGWSERRIACESGIDRESSNRSTVTISHAARLRTMRPGQVRRG
ncbi:MAG: hypothetical protein N3A38_13700 [Planctomycetota bacterium]|nr:hypothetical protein [Planctomycetota bacterium]